MPHVSLKIVSADGYTITTTDSGEVATLVHTREYQEGDRIIISVPAPGQHVILQLDEAMLPALVYLTEREVEYFIPFGEKTIPLSPKAFAGNRHVVTARVPSGDEINAIRNLALNPYDSHENEHMFPHSSANVETRGESVFASRNAIDGVYANLSHGAWPYQSWGINQNPKAEFTVDFGTPCQVSRVGITLRADFPHDNYWVKATLVFSDGSEHVVDFVKTPQPQFFDVDVVTSSITLKDMITSDEPSPFPALTQLEAWGTELRG
ncbi:hypothetical protein SAMN06298212_12613 [Ruaniaceae bacterium KH17]|nr:hypothetical protein SAMN06298212_12613 [Ruaniaceae bacterium KH17]